MTSDIIRRTQNLSRKIVTMTRFCSRRDQILEMIDFDAMPSSFALETSMMDDRLEEQLNDLHLEIDYLEDRLTELS